MVFKKMIRLPRLVAPEAGVPAEDADPIVMESSHNNSLPTARDIFRKMRQNRW